MEHHRTNILLAISDDQSWLHTSIQSASFIRTPHFERVAKEGVLFTHAYCSAPQCSPSRAAILTGRNIWELEEAGVHGSSFPSKFKTYPDLLEEAGYHVGYTGKPWSPGSFADRGRNPAGTAYHDRQLNPPTKYISTCDYAANFAEFLKCKSKDAPFVFWYGGREPHRPYEKGIGLKSGKKTSDVNMEQLPFLPDVDCVRSDLLDYAFSIEWFDRHLGLMLDQLEAIGELDNTLVVVTSDNGMAFPKAKANLYDASNRVPLAIRWGNKMKGGRIVNDFINLNELAPTFLEAAGLEPPSEMSSQSLIQVLLSGQSGSVDPGRDRVYYGLERHGHSRMNNVGYPSRALRTQKYLYIRNFKPDRYPAGDPPYYHDLAPGPTKDFLIENRDKEEIKPYYQSALGKRPGEELYVIDQDPGMQHNVADDPLYEAVKNELWADLEHRLTLQNDPRVLGWGDIWESYPKHSTLRPQLAGNAVSGQYNKYYRELADKAKSEIRNPGSP